MLILSFIRIRRLKSEKKLLELERNEKSLQVQKAIKELENANQTKNKFLSIISHDLRNPFHNMIGFTNLLIDDVSELDEQDKKEIIESLNTSLKHTYKLLEELLKWSETQSNAIMVNPAELKLDSIVTQVCQNLTPEIKNKSIIIENSCPNDLWVYADKELLSTIIRNLLSNAVKFSYKGGRVSIDAKSDNGMVKVTITDFGVGIPGENISQLFNVETRLSTAGTQNEHGTGLGLSLCREFVHLCGGTLDFESEEGKGSKFFFTIPEIFLE